MLGSPSCLMLPGRSAHLRNKNSDSQSHSKCLEGEVSALLVFVVIRWGTNISNNTSQDSSSHQRHSDREVEYLARSINLRMETVMFIRLKLPSFFSRVHRMSVSRSRLPFWPIVPRKFPVRANLEVKVKQGRLGELVCPRTSGTTHSSPVESIRHMVGTRRILLEVIFYVCLRTGKSIL